MKRIRRVYAHDERPYHAFLAILIRFRNAEFTTEQVRAPAWFRRRKPRKRPRSNRPGVFSIVDGIREAASAARDRSRRPFPATPPAGPSWKLKKNHLERGAGQMGTASQHQQNLGSGKNLPRFSVPLFSTCFLHLLDGATSPRSLTRRVPSPTPTHFPAQVIKNVATLFYDQPDLLQARTASSFSSQRRVNPRGHPQWFQWTVKTHNRFGRVSFRVAVRMLLLCEKRSRSQPPDLTKRKVRLIGEGHERPTATRNFPTATATARRTRTTASRRIPATSTPSASARVGRRDRAGDVGVREDDAGDQAHER